MTQSALAKELGVSAFSVLNWERSRVAVSIRLFPRLLAWLDEHLPKPQSLSERLYVKRRTMGLSIKRAAQMLRVDASTWAGWERGAKVGRRHWLLVESFLGVSDGEKE